LFSRNFVPNCSSRTLFEKEHSCFCSERSTVGKTRGEKLWTAVKEKRRDELRKINRKVKENCKTRNTDVNE
jgi:hypothetical protein